MTINFDTLFARIGKFLKIAADLETASGTTLVTNCAAAEDELDTEDHDFRQAVLGLYEQALESNLTTVGGMLTQLVGTPVTNLIVETVNQDTPLVQKNITQALAILIEQMDDQSESVDASTVSTSISYGENSSSAGTGDNYGSGILVCCAVRGDGRTNEFILAETIRCEVIAVNSSGQATWKLEGEPTKVATNPRWPGGSGINSTVTSNTASGTNLVTNGTFETEDANQDYLPDGWILTVGTLDTHVRLTNVEQQTVTVNGSPSGGTYTLSFTDRNGNVYTTTSLPYDASASQVQTALRNLPGLSSVTVTSTGNSPNLTHTVLFTNVPAPQALTYTSRLTGGSPTITIAATVEGSGFVARGARALEFVGDGSTLTAIQVPVTLTANTCYCLNLWAIVDVVPAAGVLAIELIDGIGGSVVADDQGTNNALSVVLSDLTTSHTPHHVCFHTPLDMPAKVYLRLRLSTALSNGTSLYLDELALVQMTELYAGGLFIAAFSGPEDFIVGDYADILVSNDRAGVVHEWLNRFLGLQAKKILLPTASPGTQPDSLIA